MENQLWKVTHSIAGTCGSSGKNYSYNNLMISFLLGTMIVWNNIIQYLQEKSWWRNNTLEVSRSYFSGITACSKVLFSNYRFPCCLVSRPYAVKSMFRHRSWKLLVCLFCLANYAKHRKLRAEAAGWWLESNRTITGSYSHAPRVDKAARLMQVMFLVIGAFSGISEESDDCGI